MPIRFVILFLLVTLSCAWAQDDETDKNTSGVFLSQTDSVQIDSLAPQAQSQHPVIVKREFNPKAQVLVGTLIMTLIIIIITTTGNWNP